MTKQEFKKRVLPSGDKFFRVALTLLGNRQEAEDILQDTFLKLWNMRNRLSEYSSVEALGVTMTKNLCVDKLRSYKHRNQNDEEVDTLPVQSELPDPGETTEHNDSLSMIHSIFKTLPDQQKLIIHLRDVEQYSYEEIETMTGLTVNTIRVNLSRARKTVREEYLKHQNYEHRKN
tara:strand:+ start:12800 stop:13324 length:525 start_codon:yes stop_codon:yes gene_type:complete